MEFKRWDRVVLTYRTNGGRSCSFEGVASRACTAMSIKLLGFAPDQRTSRETTTVASWGRELRPFSRTSDSKYGNRLSFEPGRPFRSLLIDASSVRKAVAAFSALPPVAETINTLPLPPKFGSRAIALYPSWISDASTLR